MGAVFGASRFVGCRKLHGQEPIRSLLTLRTPPSPATSGKCSDDQHQPQITLGAIRLPLAPHTHNVVASAQVNHSLYLHGEILVLTYRRFNQQALIDTTPLPDDIPKVKELGASSAPLLSASFFIGARCKAYNDDYMMCKTEANGRGELDCMKEGRKVTRCAASV
jgi:hypothetical protein